MITDDEKYYADCKVSKHFKHGGLLSAASASSRTKQEIAQPAVSATLDGSRLYGATATNKFTANLLVQARQIV
jgi:hypothetical protein